MHPKMKEYWLAVAVLAPISGILASFLEKSVADWFALTLGVLIVAVFYPFKEVFDGEA